MVKPMRRAKVRKVMQEFRVALSKTISGHEVLEQNLTIANALSEAALDRLTAGYILGIGLSPPPGEIKCPHSQL